MADYRTFRTDAISQYVGHNYAQGGSEVAMPANMVALQIGIYIRQLVARLPRVLVATKYRELKAIARLLELDINHVLGQIDLSKTLRIATLDSLFLMGIVKVGISDDAVRGGGSGQIFADRVSPDNYICDMQASSRADRQFVGDRVLLPMDQVLQSPMLTDEARRAIQRAADQDNNTGSSRRAQSIGRKSRSDEGRLVDMCAVWPLWLPQFGVIVTLPEAADRPGEVLGYPVSIQEWRGPPRGPYHELAFDEVPDNVIPKSPLADLFDMNDLINKLFRKGGRQAVRQKQILAVKQGRSEDLTTIADASDGDAVMLTDPDKAEEKSLGGISPNTLAFMMQCQEMYSRFAGNLDLLGGLGPQSKTASQDKLLNENINRRVADMQDAVMTWAGEITRDIAFYRFTDPLLNATLMLRSQSGMVQMPVVLNAADLRGEFMDYEYDIQPFSMQTMSPQAQVMAMTQVFQNFIAPYAMQLQAQGMAIDFRSTLETLASRLNLPELTDMLVFAPAPEVQVPGDSIQSNKPAHTTRTYERINRPGATTQGKDAAMMRLMMGSNDQDAELAQLSQATG